MNSAPHSSNGIAHAPNGSNSHLAAKTSPLFWLPGRVARARRDDGSFEGETPASRDSQWRTKLGRQIPDTNFGMKEDVTAEFVQSAHAAALTNQSIADVQRRGGAMFAAVWIDEHGRIEARRDVALRELGAAEGRHAILKQRRDAVPPTITKQEGRVSAPSGWGFAGFLATGGVLIAILACEWSSAATLRKFELQDLLTAFLVTSPLLGIALATKLLLRRPASPRMQNVQAMFHVFGIVAVAAWLTLFACNYGTALREDFELPFKGAVLAFTLAQFLAGIVSSAWLTLLLGGMLQPRPTEVPNPDWEKFDHDLRKPAHEINRWALLVRRELAELAGYASSREAWIARGEEAYHRTQLKLALIKEQQRFLDES